MRGSASARRLDHGVALNQRDVTGDARYDARYTALRARDASFDGVFWYAVRTTGVFCKPSCGARLPRPENVSFHGTIAAAVAAGFRPCKRCRPDQPDTLHTEIVTAVCEQINAAVAADRKIPSLDALATRSGYSPFHLHRMFKKATGLTPRAYGAASRAQRMRETLDQRDTVSQAIHDAGYSSTSRFYEQATSRLGMPASRVKAGGRGETVRYAVGASSLGPVLVAATAHGVCSIQFDDDARVLIAALRQRFPLAQLVDDDASFAATVNAVVAFVDTPTHALNLPLDIRGTVFQERVWRALTNIPAGRTATYTEVAVAIGQPTAVRAVASACAANEIAVAIPCHRVVRSTGELSGYRWGVERKRAILEREGARPARG